MSGPVYMVGIIDVKDFQTYAEEYGMPVGAMFAEVGAEIIAASTETGHCMSKKSIGQRVIGSWETLHTKPGGKRLFSFLIGCVVPYSGSIGALVEELRPGFSRLSLRDRRKVRNHLGSIHAIALANFGELTTGLAAMAGMPPNTRGILRGIEISYEKKARGRLTSTCTSEVLAPQENTEYSLRTEIRDEAGDVVARLTALWVIGPEKSVT